VRATVISGTVDGGSATGAFLQCNVDRYWDVSYAAPGSKTAVVRLEFFASGDLVTVIDTCDITLTVSRS
jgi:hypothetical protein